MGQVATAIGASPHTAHAAGACEKCFVENLAAMGGSGAEIYVAPEVSQLPGFAMNAPILAERQMPDTPRRIAKFCITIEHIAGQSIGMDLDYLDGETLHVCKVREGTILEWNRHALKDFRVRVGDRIDEVNGVSGDSLPLISMLEAGGELEIWLTRPMHVKLTHYKVGAFTLGLELDYVANGSSLRVYGIVHGRGPVNSWNKRNPKQRIALNDRIIQVNGCTGLSTQLMSEIRNADYLEILFLKYAEDD
eukprot:NODE_8551_length_1487_cov_14.827941.p1 GENE.NODE_8551_length_1487_cov_14.827941~~NODE_8551_length_1487_cov_14.827941.p1  ORF type:complete len:249 (-),score=43.05 NODE_8551_length_1487_cov_14.827941:653-1399(-)